MCIFVLSTRKFLFAVYQHTREYKGVGKDVTLPSKRVPWATTPEFARSSVDSSIRDVLNNG